MNTLSILNKLLQNKRTRIILISFLIVVLFFFLFRSCSVKKVDFSHRAFRVARDYSMMPLQLTGKGLNMRAFSDDLLLGIAKEENIKIDILSTQANNLLSGLDFGSYDGILSLLQPNVANEEKYHFSNPYYLLGPVLVVRNSSQVTSLEQMSGKIVGIKNGSSSVYDVERYPAVLLVTYDNMSIALEDLISNKIDGVILDVWTAYVYIQGFYKGLLKIATPPLTKLGLRLVARNEPYADFLIERFNKGLEVLKANGTYDVLLHKWGLFDTELKKH